MCDHVRHLAKEAFGSGNGNDELPAFIEEAGFGIRRGTMFDVRSTYYDIAIKLGIIV